MSESDPETLVECRTVDLERECRDRGLSGRVAARLPGVEPGAPQRNTLLFIVYGVLLYFGTVLAYLAFV
jgi:hypothetical protein